jgi:hypothetical protein
MRLLLRKAAAVPAMSAALLRTKRLLLEALLALPAALQSDLVHVRRTNSRARSALVASRTPPRRLRPLPSIMFDFPSPFFSLWS